MKLKIFYNNGIPLFAMLFIAMMKDPSWALKGTEGLGTMWEENSLRKALLPGTELYSMDSICCYFSLFTKEYSIVIKVFRGK